MNTALNAICPYFTMFPLEFPQRILQKHGKAGETVLDPFVGRGTTLYAARLQNMKSYGIDSNPVAIAISEAKLAQTSAKRVVAAAQRILTKKQHPQNVPSGEFWKLAFDEAVLDSLCRLREGLMEDCQSDARKALRAVILGALHGPFGKTLQSYFSNQCPRTYAPKPRYAVNFWASRDLRPPKVEVIELIQRRAERFYSQVQLRAAGCAVLGDSQREESFEGLEGASWIITSPPYYGMRTYIPDQWLRNWFIGGPPQVDYSNESQLPHSSKDEFSNGLKRVWQNCGRASKRGCRMIIRFGAINDRNVDALRILKRSLVGTEWRITTCRDAGTASEGRRQANHFVSADDPITEYDVWAVNE